MKSYFKKKPKQPIKVYKNRGIMLNGDCAIVLKNIKSNVIDLTVTSPPYDKLRNYDGYTFDFKIIAKELYRVTKEGGVVVWIVGDSTIDGSETGTSFKQVLYFNKIGFNIHDTMIYNRNAQPNNSNRYSQDFEYMFILSKGKVKTFNPLLEKCRYAGDSTSPTRRNTDGDLIKTGKRIVKDFKKKSNIWFYVVGNNKSSSDKEAHKHPAIFPEKLASDHIKSWTNEGEIVLDPFIGSGTTAISCLKLNRKFIGIEISNNYFKRFLKRIQKFYNKYKRAKWWNSLSTL